jgi:hypothetical protein
MMATVIVSWLMLKNIKSLRTIKHRHEINSKLVCGNIDVIATSGTGEIDWEGRK